MKIGVLFSGGKDSTLTAFLMQNSGFDVELITFIPKNKHSYMLHSENLNVSSLVAKAMELKQHIFFISGEKEKEIDEMLKCIGILNIQGLASGATESEYQKQRIDYIGEMLNIPTYSILWHRNYFEELNYLDVILVKYAAYGINKSLLGKRFRIYSKLIHPFLEGGEGETLVLDAPFFKYKIVIDDYLIKDYKTWGELIIKKAHLEGKHEHH